jgi:hypothetical protein
LSFGSFLRAFSPIAVSIAGALVLGLLSHELSKRGLDVLIAVVMGLATLAATGVTTKSLLNALRGSTIYDITLATFGAFLLRNVVSASGLSGALKSLVPSGSPGLLLVATVSTLCGFCLGSASGGLAVSISVLKDVMNFSFREAALAYMATWLHVLDT